MEPGRKGHAKCSDMFDVSLKRSDSYREVISKACGVVGMELSEELYLFSSRGSVISNDMINNDGKESPWTLGAYLCKRHVAPEKITFGIGSLSEEFVQPPPATKKKKGHRK